MRTGTEYLQWIAAPMLIALTLGLAPLTAGAETSGKPKMVEFWKPGESGQRMRIRGRVIDLSGRPVGNVTIRIRHADSEGLDWSYYHGEVVANDKGLYQFGSVIPGNSHRLSHVHVYVDHPGYQYIDTEFHFKNDPKAAMDDPYAIFLEEGTVGGNTMMFGRYDITLIPQ